jgi:hypothetical protein
MCGFHGYIAELFGAALPSCSLVCVGSRLSREVSVTGLFLAERHLSANTGLELAAVVDDDRAAARLASIHHVRTTYAPGDETCFSALEAPSLETIQQANHRFQLG